MQGAAFAMLGTYVLASFHDVPGVVYAVKWLTLAAFAGAATLAAPRIRLDGMPAVIAFLPWFMLALGYQLVIGPTGRGVGVGGGYLGLLVLTFVLVPSAVRGADAEDAFERWAITALAAFGLLAIVVGLHHFRDSIVGSPEGRGIRVRWAFEHVNTPGYLGFVGIALSARQLVLRRWRFIVPMGVFAILLVGAWSRGAILALCTALGIGTILSLLGASRSVTVRLLLAGGALALVTAALALVVGSATEVSFHAVNEFSSGRLGEWRSALAHLNSPTQWLIGKGAGQNISYTGQGVALGGSSDSFIVDLITRSGIVGLACWMASVGVIGVMVARQYRAVAGHGSRVRFRRATAVGLFVSALVASAYEGATFSVGTTYSLVLWSSVGLACLNGDPTST